MKMALHFKKKKDENSITNPTQIARSMYFVIHAASIYKKVKDRKKSFINSNNNNTSTYSPISHLLYFKMMLLDYDIFKAEKYEVLLSIKAGKKILKGSIVHCTRIKYSLH